jgi:hypothetical protein
MYDPTADIRARRERVLLRLEQYAKDLELVRDTRERRYIEAEVERLNRQLKWLEKVR